MLKLDKIPDKTINRWILIAFLVVISILTLWRLLPILLAGPAKRAKQIMNAPFPPSASDVHYSDQAGFNGGDYFISAKMSKPDFVTFTGTLGVTNKTDLFQKAPEALSGKNIDWWPVSKTNDADTFFVEHPPEFSWIVVRYQDGTFYYHRHVIGNYKK